MDKQVPSVGGREELPKFLVGIFDNETPIKEKFNLPVADWKARMEQIFGMESQFAMKLMLMAAPAMPGFKGLNEWGSLSTCMNGLVELVVSREPQNSTEAIECLLSAVLQRMALGHLSDAMSMQRDKQDMDRHAEARERRAIRLLGAYQRIEDGLHRRRYGGKQSVTVVHQHVNINNQREGDGAEIIEPTP